VVIENGYDEPDFGPAPAPMTEPFTLLHTGVVYPSERDPSALFAALRALAGEGGPAIRLRLRASGHDTLLAALAAENGVANLIELASPLPHREALAEMQAAPALLLLQASNCNHQVPAKLYEYLRARRPLLALTDADGDTATILRRAGISTIAPLDDAQQIAAALRRFVAHPEASLASPGYIATCTRAARTRELAELLDQVTRPAASA
jgi:hypothetical protein